MTELLQSYLQTLLVHYDHAKQLAYQQILEVYPRYDNYNHF